MGGGEDGVFVAFVGGILGVGVLGSVAGEGEWKGGDGVGGFWVCTAGTDVAGVGGAGFGCCGGRGCGLSTRGHA